jgi:hypothetical protein
LEVLSVRSLKPTLLKLLLSLLLMPTVYTRAGTLETIQIKKGDKSPYAGVLMPPDSFASMLADAESKQLLDVQRRDLQYRVNELEGRDSYGPVWFAVGVLLGGYVGLKARP